MGLTITTSTPGLKSDPTNHSTSDLGELGDLEVEGEEVLSLAQQTDQVGGEVDLEVAGRGLRWESGWGANDV